MWKAYGATDRGLVRETNQDSYAMKLLEDGAMLAIVCDGMGGEHGGNIASRNAVNIVGQHILSNYRPQYNDNAVRNVMLVAVSVANNMVYDMSCKNSYLAGMGTTVVACVVKNGVAHFVHAGDSRAYLLENGKARQLTRDHSVVQMLLENGEVTEEEARVHPKKHYITRALGVAAQLETEYSECELPAGAMLLLCTDGLSNQLMAEELARTASEHEPEEVPALLVQAANAAGGPDNSTALLLCER